MATKQPLAVYSGQIKELQAGDTLPAAAIPSLSYQPLDPTLTALAAANWAANAVPIGSGTDALSQVAFAANTFPARASTGNLVAKAISNPALTLLAQTSQADMRQTGLGLGSIATQMANSLQGTFTNFGGLNLWDNVTTFSLAINFAEDPTDNRTLNINVGDADRNLTLNGNLTVAAAATVSGTNTGDQTSIVGITGTLAQFNTALTGADFATGGGTATGTNTGDQTSVTGNAGTVTVADAGGDTTTWPMLATSQTGNLSPATDAGLTYDAATNKLVVGSAKLHTPNSTSFFLAGDPAGSYSGTFNVFIGDGAGAGNVAQHSNTYVGSGAGSGTSGDAYFNTFIGRDAGKVSTGRENTFIGYNVGVANTSGAQNTFVGKGAGAANVSGTSNTFVGINAGLSNTANSNSAFGFRAGDGNTSGTDNSFFGVLSGYQNQGGTNNVFAGQRAGMANVSGNYNVFVGDNAGNQSTGSQNVFVGRTAGSNLTSGATNCMIGYNVQATSATGSNQTNINDTYLASSSEAWIAGTRNFKFLDGNNVVLGTTTGSKHGTATTQKQSWWNATPVVQSTGWAATNYTPSKTLDKATATLAQAIDFLCTLEEQLKTYGLLGA